jgi:hypothetical protein
VKIPYKEIWKLPGFNQGDNFQGLRFLDEQKGQDILAGLSIETAAAAHLADQLERSDTASRSPTMGPWHLGRSILLP